MSEENKEQSHEQKEEHHYSTHKHNEHTEEQSSTEDNLKIDFSKITNPLKKVFKSKEDKPKKSDRQKKLITTGIIIGLLIIVIFFSTFYRAYPYSLPIFNDQAKQQVENAYKNQIANQIQAGNQNLPQAALIQQTEAEYQQQLASNPNLSQQINTQIEQLAQNSKAQMQNANGQTYLLAIDPYLWYSFAKWYEKTGMLGNKIDKKTGRVLLEQRNGRIGRGTGFIVHPLLIVLTDKIISIFNPSQDIFSTSFFMPILLMGLGGIAAFFLGRKFGGIPGGFFAAIIFVLSPSILGRTAAGFSDTDAYTFIFPFLILWLFLEAIEAKTTKTRIIYSLFTGLAVVLFRFTWGGWWFTFDFILGLAVIYFIYDIIRKKVKARNEEEGNIKSLINIKNRSILFIVTLIVSTIVFMIALSLIGGINPSGNLNNLISAPLQPINFVLGFKGAASGVGIGGAGLNYPLWPNVLTTVAELNAGTPQQIIGQAGGTVLFILGILGAAALFFYKKDDEWYPLYGIILTLWMGSTYYAGLTGVRFIALFSPVIGFGIAGLIGILTGKQVLNYLANLGDEKKKELTKRIITATVIIVMLLMLFLPINNFPQMFTTADAVAKGEVPSYDDTWNNALQTIKNSSDKAIISSWWDFGHWFEAMSERSVTFDGGDQGKRIYWIGLSLLSADENETVDILKMLNCGQEESYNLLEKDLMDKYDATMTLKKIIRQEKDEAKETLLAKGLTEDQTNEVLNLTHCSDLYDMYYITSGDMVGKAGVWGHFGAWDFKKAYMYYNLKNKPITIALDEAQTKLGLTEEEAKQQFLQVQKLSNEQQAGTWISPWPNYVTSNPVTCKDMNESITCEYNIGIGSQNGANLILWRSIINKENPEKSQLLLKVVNTLNNVEVGRNPIKPASYTIYKDGEFKRYETGSNEFNYDVLLFQDANGDYKSMVLNPLLTQSTFTKLFYMDGEGMNHFEKVFDQTAPGEGRVIVWKVNV